MTYSAQLGYSTNVRTRTRQSVIAIVNGRRVIGTVEPPPVSYFERRRRERELPLADLGLSLKAPKWLRKAQPLKAISKLQLKDAVRLAPLLLPFVPGVGTALAAASRLLPGAATATRLLTAAKGLPGIATGTRIFTAAKALPGVTTATRISRLVRTIPTRPSQPIIAAVQQAVQQALPPQTFTLPTEGLTPAPTEPGMATTSMIPTTASAPASFSTAGPVIGPGTDPGSADQSAPEWLWPVALAGGVFILARMLGGDHNQGRR